MSPIEYIKEGICSGNWETVCHGYERLTGETLPLPPITTSTNDIKCALQQIVNIASSVLTERSKSPVKRKPGRPRGSTKQSNEKTTKKTTIASGEEDVSIQLDDSNKTSVQKETDGTRLITNEPDPEEVEQNRVKATRARRNKAKLKRKSIKTYEVKCNECEKLFESDRPQGKMGQKCRKCLNDKKGRFA